MCFTSDKHLSESNYHDKENCCYLACYVVLTGIDFRTLN